MNYAVLDLGDEKLVARYIGPSAQVAFNESVLRESLASLEGQRLVAAPLDPVEKMEWSTAGGADGQRRVPVPRGWIVEPSAPSSCPGLPHTNAAAAALAPRDFTVVLRAAVWSSRAIVADDAASACSTRRGTSGRSSYISHVDWLGTSYSIEGVFAPIGPDQIAQLEVVTPDSKSAYGRALLAAWIQKATER